MNECLDVLLDHLQRLKQRVHNHRSHQTAADAVVSIAKQEMQPAPPVRTADASFAPTIPMSPIKVPTRSHARMHSRSHSRQKSVPSTPGDISSLTALESVLSNLAISLPYLPSAGHGDQVRAISKVLAERTRKAQDVSRNAQESFESNVVAQIEDMKTAVQLLRDSVLAESAFGEVKLVDGDLEESIEVLGQEVEKLKAGLEKVHKERDTVVKSEKKEEIVSRWGR